jgi:hypothetical protein
MRPAKLVGLFYIMGILRNGGDRVSLDIQTYPIASVAHKTDEHRNHYYML